MGLKLIHNFFNFTIPLPRLIQGISEGTTEDVWWSKYRDLLDDIGKKITEALPT